MLLSDKATFIREVAVFLSETPPIQVVGWTRPSPEALHLAGVLDLDLVVIDLGAREIDGLDATRRIKAANPGRRVCLLAPFSHPAYEAAAAEARADAVLAQSDLGNRLLPLFHQLFPGRMAPEEAASSVLSPARTGNP
jgi:two-component system, NarL family, response regulator DesR